MRKLRGDGWLETWGSVEVGAKWAHERTDAEIAWTLGHEMGHLAIGQGRAYGSDGWRETPLGRFLTRDARFAGPSLTEAQHEELACDRFGSLIARDAGDGPDAERTSHLKAAAGRMARWLVRGVLRGRAGDPAADPLDPTGPSHEGATHPRWIARVPEAGETRTTLAAVGGAGPGSGTGPGLRCRIPLEHLRAACGRARCGPRRAVPGGACRLEGTGVRAVRIPVQADHRFRRKPITDSGRTRSPIPVPSRSLFGADRNRAIRPM